MSKRQTASRTDERMNSPNRQAMMLAPLSETLAELVSSLAVDVYEQVDGALVDWESLYSHNVDVPGSTFRKLVKELAIPRLAATCMFLAAQ